ncbi:sulfotransferase [Serinicoccus marinus]|uniref:sulfotransferase family protein n=1 Tax=Serinicoccus marinus TaxID=247333 RepID=UPI0031F0BFA4
MHTGRAIPQVPVAHPGGPGVEPSKPMTRERSNPVKIRRRLPPSVQNALRPLSVQVQRITAAYRPSPTFIVAGAQRCGTTSLFRALEQHPQMTRPSFHKGINYFDLNYGRGAGWYTAHFPLTALDTLRTPREYRPSLPFEASGYYMFHPAAFPRIARDLPDVKIVLMLRDPVERAYSAWKHEHARGFERESFTRALELEDSRLEGEVERMLADPSYESHAHRHLAYAARSDYVPQIERLLTLLPAEQVHVVYSEDFFAKPEQEMSALATFLDARDYPGITFDRHNARPSGSMPSDARDILQHKLARTYEEISELVGRPSPWHVE